MNFANNLIDRPIEIPSSEPSSENWSTGNIIRAVFAACIVAAVIALLLWCMCRTTETSRAEFSISGNEDKSLAKSLPNAIVQEDMRNTTSAQSAQEPTASAQQTEDSPASSEEDMSGTENSRAQQDGNGAPAGNQMLLNASISSLDIAEEESAELSTPIREVQISPNIVISSADLHIVHPSALISFASHSIFRPSNDRDDSHGSLNDNSNTNRRHTNSGSDSGNESLSGIVSASSSTTSFSSVATSSCSSERASGVSSSATNVLVQQSQSWKNSSAEIKFKKIEISKRQLELATWDATTSDNTNILKSNNTEVRCFVINMRGFYDLRGLTISWGDTSEEKINLRDYLARKLLSVEAKQDKPMIQYLYLGKIPNTQKYRLFAASDGLTKHFAIGTTNTVVRCQGDQANNVGLCDESGVFKIPNAQLMCAVNPELRENDPRASFVYNEYNQDLQSVVAVH